MKLKEYVDSLNKLLADNPEAAEYMTVYSLDDEDNSCNTVRFEPSIGSYDEKEFYDKYGMVAAGLKPNCVCVN